MFRLKKPFNHWSACLQKSFYSKKVFIEVYGCQMNTNDAEIVQGILAKNAQYEKCDVIEQADVVLLMTCAIRENAEKKIWNRLEALRAFEKAQKKPLTIGVLGCMAERLKGELLERSKIVDLICGPDAYRDLPNLLQSPVADREKNINVSLSADETYADVKPVRLDAERKSAFVSIMRGCNNMCAFCIVPFVRGRERSRPLESIVEEVKHLHSQGIKEITLLGQNVNSYCDESSESIFFSDSTAQTSVPGFSSVFKAKRSGARFADLLDKVSQAAPDSRIRFTSPHPKDFPLPLLHLIKERANLCKHIHLPAQSGSSTVLERMRRGYTREAYLDLVNTIRSIIPEVTLSSDFISGFVGETVEDHLQTVDLIKTVGFDMAYMYAYSMREKTMAHRRYIDDIPEEEKQRRLREVIDSFYSTLPIHSKRFIGTRQLVLIEGASKKDSDKLQGRSDGNRTVILTEQRDDVKVGDFVEVEIEGLSNTALLGKCLTKAQLSAFA